jgi:hypothetical protein
VTLAYRWSHFRRRFLDIAKGGNADRDRGTAAYRRALQDRGGHPWSLVGRAAQRQDRTNPLIESLNTWLEKQLACVPGRSTIAKDNSLRPESLGRAHALPQ